MIDFKKFGLSPMVSDLLNVFQNAPKGFLSKEDIRQDVMFDYDASEKISLRFMA